MKNQFYQVKTNSERYVSRKDSLAKLFNSEKYFLEEMLFNNATVLDVGCGGGAFKSIT